MQFLWKLWTNADILQKNSDRFQISFLRFISWELHPDIKPFMYKQGCQREIQ